MADQNFVVRLVVNRLNAVLDTVVPVLGPAGPPGPRPTGPTALRLHHPWTQNEDAAG